MEKLMTTFSKSKEDIIKTALKNAKQTASAKNKQEDDKNSEKQKNKKNPSKVSLKKETKKNQLPWQKSEQEIIKEFQTSCDQLEKVVTIGLSEIINLVDKKNVLKIYNIKEEILEYLNTYHRKIHYLKNIESFSSKINKIIKSDTLKSKTEIPESDLKLNYDKS